jgi:hypothetical protein
VTGGWRKLHKDKLRDVYFTLSIIKIIRSRRDRLAGHVARMGRSGMHIGWWESQRGKGPLGRPRHRWWIIQISRML